jgi:Lrp/AsnC family leucine-responsive transcriptional regulator
VSTNVVHLDAIDRAVLEHLQRDSRSTYAEIGAAVGLSAAAVHSRVKQLERKGVITGYGARLDAAAVGLPVTAFLAVRVENGLTGDAVKAALTDIAEIEELHGTAGSIDLMLKVRAASPVHLEDLIRRVRLAPGVDRTDTTVVLSTTFESRPLVVPAPPT